MTEEAKKVMAEVLDKRFANVKLVNAAHIISLYDKEHKDIFVILIAEIESKEYGVVIKGEYLDKVLGNAKGMINKSMGVV